MIRKYHDQPAELRPNMRGGSGTVSVQQLFAPEAFGASVRLCARLTLPVGASIGDHPHDGEDEIYVITRGQGLLADSGVETVVGPGDAVLTGRGAAHSIANSGDEPLELIAFIVRYPAPPSAT
jgi:mannose-6-phosphate isomerase-like protein (cupin superfamily)